MAFAAKKEYLKQGYLTHTLWEYVFSN
jgi:hypothetical protein